MTGFSTSRRLLATLLSAGAASALFSGAAWAETRKFDVPANSAAEGVRAFAAQAGVQALISDDVARGKRTNSVRGDLSVAEGWRRLLVGSGLRAEATSEGVFGVVLDASSNTVGAASSTSPAETTTVSELIIVGSRNGGRSNFASPTPISAINEQQIDHAATLPGETGSIIAAFAPSFEFPRYSNDGAADTVRTGQLRGLKPDETLVLINGKRAHTTSVLAVEGSNGLYTAPFDYNTVPTNAIERIEVLTDGAGAQYGSDAIAGVINLVLKKSTGTGQLTAAMVNITLILRQSGRPSTTGKRTHSMVITAGKLVTGGIFMLDLRPKSGLQLIGRDIPRTRMAFAAQFPGKPTLTHQTLPTTQLLR